MTDHCADGAMNNWYYFRNDPAILDSMLWLTVSANQIKFDPSLTAVESTEPFILGRRLQLREGRVPCVATGGAEIYRLTIQSGGVFADKVLANALARELGDLVQIFEIFERITNDPQFEDFRLINLTRTVDCVDKLKSDVEWWPDEPDRMHSISTIVLDESRLSPSDLVFRLAGAAHVIVASAEGREAMLRAGVPPEYFGDEIF